MNTAATPPAAGPWWHALAPLAGPSPVYYGSGYLPLRDWWWLRAVFGVVILATFLLVGVPWVRWRGS